MSYIFTFRKRDPQYYIGETLNTLISGAQRKQSCGTILYSMKMCCSHCYKKKKVDWPVAWQNFLGRKNMGKNGAESEEQPGYSKGARLLKDR